MSRHTKDAIQKKEIFYREQFPSVKSFLQISIEAVSISKTAYLCSFLYIHKNMDECIFEIFCYQSTRPKYSKLLK